MGYTDEYMTFSGRIPMEVRCKGDCPAILVQRRGVAQNLRMDKTNNYGELVIAMSEPNGLMSKHETPMCRSCRDRLRSGGARPGEIVDIYKQDMLQMIKEAVRAGVSQAEADRMAAHFWKRVPLGVLSERGRGETFI